MEIAKKLQERILTVIYIIAGSIVCFWVIKFSFGAYKIYKDGLPTIAECLDIDKGAQQAENIRYRYCVNGKYYEGERKSSQTAKKGNKYLVLYSKTSPNISLLIFEKRDGGLCTPLEYNKDLKFRDIFEVSY